MRNATEDLTGIGLVTWHESFAPYVDDSCRAPVKAPAYVREQLARLRVQTCWGVSTREDLFRHPVRRAVDLGVYEVQP